MPTILIADDSAMVRKKYEFLFKDTEFDLVASAKNGREAVDLYAEHKPDLVTLDMTMPELDGIGALTAIRKADPDATVLIVSALDQKALIVEAVKFGACDYVVKPFDDESLLAKLRAALERSDT